MKNGTDEHNVLIFYIIYLYMHAYKLFFHRGSAGYYLAQGLVVIISYFYPNTLMEVLSWHLWGLELGYACQNKFLISRVSYWAVICFSTVPADIHCAKVCQDRQFYKNWNLSAIFVDLLIWFWIDFYTLGLNVGLSFGDTVSGCFSIYRKWDSNSQNLAS